MLAQCASVKKKKQSLRHPPELGTESRGRRQTHLKFPLGHKMISAQVKGIFSWEMDDLERHVPEDLHKFCVLVRAMVGPRGTEGEESFDIEVCTPEWLKEQVEREGFVLGARHLFVKTYDPVQIRTVISKLIERYSGDSWSAVAQKISRIAIWEFEDCKPDLQG
jgi:hypothetical protein